MDRSMRICFVVLLVGTLGCFVATAARTVVVGIDLGTTDSCAAVCRNGYVEIIRNDLGERTTPSYVSFFRDDVVLFGMAAKDRAVSNRQSTIFGVKRLIGRRFDDVEVQAEIQRLPYPIINMSGDPRMDVSVAAGRPRITSPVEVSTMLLAKMTEYAEASVGESIGDAVITVPAHFNDAQRQATRQAAIISGLYVRALIDEPSAVAIAYDLQWESGRKNVLVFDLGGGTFDASILAIDNGHIQILSTSGDTRLGGENFDERILEHFIELFKEKHGIDISEDISALSRLRWKIEYEISPRLNYESSVQVLLTNFYQGLEFSETLTRDKFEELNADLFNKTIQHVLMAMSDAGLQKSQIDKILLSGKSSRIPKVQHLLEEYFDGMKPTMDVDPDVVVAYGAAVEGSNLVSGVGRGKDGDDLRKLQII